jgi:membrane protease YdiL (CAAX protease family)
VLLAPPVEEFVFRGVLWAGLSRSLPRPLSAVVVCASFILSHVTEARGYWPAWLAISTLAVALLAFRVRGGSLLPAWVLHTSYNTALVVAAYLLIG